MYRVIQELKQNFKLTRTHSHLLIKETWATIGDPGERSPEPREQMSTYGYVGLFGDIDTVVLSSMLFRSQEGKKKVGNTSVKVGNSRQILLISDTLYIVTIGHYC